MFALLAFVFIVAQGASQQQPLNIVAADATYQLGPSAIVNTDEGLYSHELIINDLKQRQIDKIRWNDHASSFARGVAYKSKVVLIGDVDGNGQAISILDIASKRNVLFILCRAPTFSPSKRYVGYLQFKPRSLDDSLDDIVLLLDLENLPVTEPSSAGWVVDSTNVGTAIYPSTYVGKTRFFANAVGDRALRLITSPLAWDSKLETLAFISRENGQLFIVSADITGGTTRPSMTRRNLNSRQFLLDQSNDPEVLKNLDKLIIDKIAVENGKVSVWPGQIPNVKLQRIEVPIRQ